MLDASPRKRGQMKRITMKRIIKWLAIICLIPISLVLIVSILLYIPSIQKFAVDKATTIASDKTGMDIRVEKIRLRFPLDLAVSGVNASSPADSASASLGRITLSVNPLPLLKKQVEISAFALEDAVIQSGNWIEGMKINGNIGYFKASPNEIDLTKETAQFKLINLNKTDLFIQIDSIASDTTTVSEPVNWKILVDLIQLEQVAINLTMPADSLSLTAKLQETHIDHLQVDLGQELYTLSSLRIRQSLAGVDMNFEPPALSGIDPNHLALQDINILMDSVHYQGKDIRAIIQEFSANERSGLSLLAEGSITSDSNRVVIPQFLVRTPYSKMELSALVPWKAIEDDPQGESMRLSFHAAIGKEDIQLAGGKELEPLMREYPQRPVTLLADVEGNLSQLFINKVRAQLPGVFSMDLTGKARNLTDERKRSGAVNLKAETDNLNFLLAALPVELSDSYHIPAGIKVTGDFGLQNGAYSAKAILTEADTHISLAGIFNPLAEKYKADLDIQRLEPIRYMPQDSLMLIEGFVNLEGKGFDIFKTSTKTSIDAALSSVVYAKTTIKDIQLKGSLDENRVNVTLNSGDTALALNGLIDGLIKKDTLQAIVVIEADSIDFYGLKLTQKPFGTSFQIFSELESNLQKNHRLDVTLGNWELIMPKRRFSPKTLTLYAQTEEDTTRVSFHAGDFMISASANSDPATLGSQLSAISDSLMLQLKNDSMVNLSKIRPYLPDLTVSIKADKDNPFYMAAQYFNVFFDRFRLNASTSPIEGINVTGSLHSLILDTLKIDTITLGIHQGEDQMNYLAEIKKNRFRKQSPFFVSVGGKMRNNYIDIAGLYQDNRKDTVVYIGANARNTPEGIRVSVFPENPILAYIPFKINTDNYFIFQDKDNMKANLRMEGDQLASLWLHSTPDSGAMEALMLEINRINLDSLSSAIPSAPPLSGYINSSFRYEPFDSSFIVAADVVIDSLVFDNGLIGDLLMQGVYLPSEGTNHQLDMHLFKDDQEISSMYVHYTADGNDKINGFLNIDHMPLLMFNPMIPGGMGKMKGALHGEIKISGTTEAPLINGAMHLDTAGVYIPSVGTEVSFEEKEITVDNNLILIDKYKLYTHDNNPFVIDGNINARNLSKPTANLKLTAKKMKLMDAPKTKESMLYGKFNIDLNSTIKGPLHSLMMRGNLHILGNTDVTYIMTESPLTSKDRMSGLVTFTYFQDTIPVSTNRGLRFRKAISGMESSGMDILLGISIDPSVKAKVELNEDGTDYIDLNGGGDLSFIYNSVGDMQLNGRYRLNRGTLKYNLPIIPNKELSIADGSYVEFTGDPMDPYLNIIATERIRAAVSDESESSRLVNFDAGIIIRETMNDLSLKFTLSAEDMDVQNQLTAMGEEERSKYAVAMLVTGIYLGSGGSGGLDMNAALSSFLQNEINNIAGSALKGVDISVGMETYKQDGLGERTDFSFRFSKKLFNDRVNIILGGRIATGEGAENNQSFIDDATIEYRLDEGGTRYIKVFHNKNYENLLEGEVMETGAGIVFRKRMLKIQELFYTRKKKLRLQQEEEDEENQERYYNKEEK